VFKIAGSGTAWDELPDATGDYGLWITDATRPTQEGVTVVYRQDISKIGPRDVEIHGALSTA